MSHNHGEGFRLGKDLLFAITWTLSVVAEKGSLAKLHDREVIGCNHVRVSEVKQWPSRSRRTMLRSWYALALMVFVIA